MHEWHSVEMYAFLYILKLGSEGKETNQGTLTEGEQHGAIAPPSRFPVADETKVSSRCTS